MKKTGILIFLSMSLAVFAGEIPKINEIVLREAMQEKLKDADSAKLRKLEIFASKKSNEVFHICGEVNAKNGFGAYVGFTPFTGFYINEKKYYVMEISEVAGQVCEMARKGKV